MPVPAKRAPFTFADVLTWDENERIELINGKAYMMSAPDLIVEVLSPSTQRHDQLVKLNLYQRAGVREYWIVDPENRTIRVMLQEGGVFRTHEVYRREDVAKVNVLPGYFIELSKVFSE